MNFSTQALEALDIPVTEDTRPPMPSGDDAAALASSLRVCRHMLRRREEELELMIKNLRAQHPAFDTVYSDCKKLPEEIKTLQDKLDTLVRNLKHTLDLGSVYIKYEDPKRTLADLNTLMAYCPDAEQLAPEIFVRDVKVDPKLLEKAVAAGALPDIALQALRKESTTNNGRVTFAFKDEDG